MRETAARGFPVSPAGVFDGSDESELDDWLGDISDEDWNEGAAERAARERTPPVREGLILAADDSRQRSAADRPDTAGARRATIERRRLAAGLVLVVVLGIAAAVGAVLYGGGDNQTTVAPAETAVTPPAPSEGRSPSTTTTPTTTPPAAAPSTTPPPSAVSGFTLPEGTKLRLGEGDPVVVRELQQALASAGYDPGPADGTFGPKTQAAVVAFQQDNGLSADGVVGPETASALNSAESTPGSTASSSTPSTSGASGFTLPEGTKLQLGAGDPAVVRELQQALASAGYDPGSADGTFGPKTQAAVVAFQQDNGLSADGVVGPETASALNSAISG